MFSGSTTRYDRIYQGLGNSLVLALVTVLIMLLVLLPTMILVELRFRRLRRVLEVVCLLPIMIPAIVMVVGLAPTYSVVTQIFGVRHLDARLRLRHHRAAVRVPGRSRATSRPSTSSRSARRGVRSARGG